MMHFRIDVLKPIRSRRPFVPLSLSQAATFPFISRRPSGAPPFEKHFTRHPYHDPLGTPQNKNLPFCANRGFRGKYINFLLTDSLHKQHASVCFTLSLQSSDHFEEILFKAQIAF